ncbi:HU family DNA-binding protein [Nocardioides humi]|uniref:HU family DNA-binding protein n=1 Tax=Nocardioides humi TaxID=449461 RepID=A0ABN2A517_9ACTN|nr:HU family DNA-binding protein [Nocardioides humi]
MNRTDLTAAVAEATGLTTHQAAEAVAATLDGIARGVAEHGSVALPGFGTFERRDRAARSGRNPQTGEPMEIPATVAPAFKPAAAFRRQVAEGRTA